MAKKANNLGEPEPFRPGKGKMPKVEPIPEPPPLPPLPVPPDPHPLPPDFISVFRAAQLQRLAREKARRKIEGLRLYEPLPLQLAFHASMAPERLLRGSNRGGKTLPAAVEVARAVTGQDPFDRYPKQGGRCYCVGQKYDHIGEVMWPKLGRAGAYQIIRDEVTGLWRVFRKWDPADLARARQAKPAPPLIPPRLIKSIAWEEKKRQIPKLIQLHNGWELAFYSSEGDPPNGTDVDLVWFDEEIERADWYTEMAARLLDRAGHFIWSATPQVGTDQLFELHERAEAAKDLQEKPSVEEFVILLSENPHITEEQKKLLVEKLSEEEQLVRIGGEFASKSFKVFPEYTRPKHWVSWFEIPRTWTRYASIDPGRQVCAVLFLAVPPPEDGHGVYLYDELYIKNCDAEQFAQAMSHKCAGQCIQAFLIDHHGGRHTDAGSGLTVEYQYEMALRRHKVASIATGHGFHWGEDNVDAGVEAFRAWLADGEGGPKVRILSDRLPNLDWELRHYRYKKVNGVITDKPEDRGRVHQMANCRYLAAFSPRYIKPPAGKAPVGAALRAFRDKEKRRKERDGPRSIRLGPGRGK